jgi:hypothetical protein
MLVLDDGRPEAISEKMTFSAMAPVEALCVEAVEPVKPKRELLPSGADEQVVVVRHQAPRVELPFESNARCVQEIDEEQSVVVIAIDGLVADSPAGHMKDTVGKETAGDARHPDKVGAEEVRRACLGRVDTDPAPKRDSPW